MVERFQGELPTFLQLLARPAGLLPLGPALTLAVRRFAARRPSVFERLGSYATCSFLVEPSDLALSFLVVPDGPRAEIRTVARSADVKADVHVRAPLLVLLGLLDGTFDGDALFFNRTVAVSGRTDALVALRNAIEDAELKPSDFIGLTGRPADLLDRIVETSVETARRLTSAPVLDEVR